MHAEMSNDNDLRLRNIFLSPHINFERLYDKIPHFLHNEKHILRSSRNNQRNKFVQKHTFAVFKSARVRIFDRLVRALHTFSSYLTM